MVDIRELHNKVVDRLTKTVRVGEVRADQQIPDFPDRSRPDIIITADDDFTIIDVTCPFENDQDALSVAETSKVNKYHHLKQYYINQDFSCPVFVFVIGSLGAWHPADEEAVLSKIIRKLCYTDFIQGSPEIYFKHMSN